MELESPLDKTVKIVNWKVKEGNSIHPGNIIFEYVECGPDGEENAGNKFKFKATQPGVIRQILAQKGASVTKGAKLLILDPAEQCTHPIVMHDMCGVCSQDLRKLDEQPGNSASVAMVHSVPGLKVSMEEAQMLGKLDEQHLIKERKLVLLVDLDQTLIHTTNDNVPINLENVFHFQLRSHGSVWYHTRLRPGTHEFLEKMNKYFQLHICTFGTRQYANTIAHYLDPKGKFFADRILSRDECFSHNSKTANLKELFPRGDHMVCIIDDREDVWSFATNLIHVKPYHFFRHTGDINAPPGLTKKDDDDKTGFEFPSDMDKTVTKTPDVVSKTSSSIHKDKSNKTVQNSEKSQVECTVSKSSEVVEIEAGEIVDQDEEDNNMEVDEEASDTIKPVQKLKCEDEEASDTVKPVPEKLKCEDEEASDTVKPVPEELKCEDEEASDTVKPVPEKLNCENEEASDTVKPVPEKLKCEDEAETKTEEGMEVAEILQQGEEKSNDVKNCEGDEKEPTVETGACKDVPDLDKELPSKSSNNSEPLDNAITEIETKDDKPRQAESSSDEVKQVNKQVSNESEVSTESTSTTKDIENEEKPATTTDEKDSKPDVIKIEDPDDYLLYLEEILLRIYHAYYRIHEDMVQKGTPGVPDVKTVIPYVRQKVLKGSSIVFSGVIPTHIQLKQSRQYAVAIGLGAHVSSKIIPPPKPGSSTPKVNEPPTTHIVAGLEGTFKVNEARKRYKSIHIVTPDWLQNCAERWERCDEKMFLLFGQNKGKKSLPAHCSSPDQSQKQSDSSEYFASLDASTDSSTNVAGPSSSKGCFPAVRKERTPSGRFMDTINPLLTFSMDEIEKMDHEVDDIFNESDSSSTTDEEGKANQDRMKRRKKAKQSPITIPQIPELDKESSSNEDTENENVGSNSTILGKRKRSPGRTETETEDEPLSTRFRRGEPLPSDLDTLNLLSGSSDEDDGGQDQDDWMAEALEREFLDENSQDTS